MLTARYTQHGPPSQVVQLAHVPLPTPGSGQVRVRVLARPINPMDQLIIRGFYPLLPTLPATPGSEGVGVVDALGAGELGVTVGQRVVLPIRAGSWCEALCVPATELVAVPDHPPAVQQAGLAVNGVTAWMLLADLVPGDWLIHNCAMGGVGQLVTQLAHHRDIHTVAVVRTKDRAAQATALGASAALIDDDTLPNRVHKATRRAPLLRALDGVGGEATARLARCLSPGGTVVHYGAMSRKSPTLGVAEAIFKDIRLEGFWLRRQNQLLGLDPAKALVAHVAAEDLTTQIAATYPLSALHEALTHAEQPHRQGRIIIADAP